jgi:DNA primase
MPRIPEDVIERLKIEIPIVQLIEASGVKLKKQGKNYVGLCSMHNDTSPSLIATPETNFWCCKGACHVGGSTIDWIMKSQGISSFRQAAEFLIKNYLPSLAAKNIDSKPSNPTKRGHTVEDSPLTTPDNAYNI